ncbi:glycogen debranching N-terminal domain-containing protein [Desulfovirgula thermocuniculi]|uniref:amylo-alpha-1,6-glucosidase n=1 Tax=Desulfovirgula thermocuniculi TaxID=348842 RepID=UPI0004241B71|nr:glycogen debranching N-terminal domain-containing protein [Desulfovirgula thermocuniculi]
MLDVAQVPGLVTQSSLATEVLKEGEMFFICGPQGEVSHHQNSGFGLYYRDTRFLSCLEMRLAEGELLFLSSYIKESHFAQFELTNPVLNREEHVIPASTIHLRALRLLDNALFQRLRLINFNPVPVMVTLQIRVGADFLDIFEVRGLKREKRGELLPPVASREMILFGYRGLDGVHRYTRISFSPHPDEVIGGRESGLVEAHFSLTLLPGKKVYLYMQVKPFLGEKPSTLPPRGKGAIPSGFSRAVRKSYTLYEKWKQECTQFESDNVFLTNMLRRNITDLYALRTDYPGLGTIIQAGIPWYAAPFGRDALITSWQSLIINPDIARESLYFLARLQGRENNPWRDEEPGKIMHELRRGELAACGEIPHTPYYGTVDATPWFIILLAETYRWTGDRKIVEDLAPNLRQAVEWCRKYGDVDGDGFIEYAVRSPRGLTNQGWKDSWDGVIDPQGNLPQGPIALVEVQGYYYLALLRAAEMARVLGDHGWAAALEEQAASLKQNFLRAFWMEEEGFLAFALDGEKRPVRTVVSNPGHCLFTGILPPELAARVAKRLLSEEMYSGWGIRTMSKAMGPYNPMSYHNGSVWPHDNAIIAYGLRTTHQLHLLEKVVTGLFEAAMFFPYYRLPEVFCGFTRRRDGGPVHYPVACNPQAWAVGTMPLLLQAMLGISCHGNEVHISSPILPPWVQEVRIYNLRAGEGRVGLEFTRKQGKTYCGVMQASGGARVIIKN